MQMLQFSLQLAPVPRKDRGLGLTSAFTAHMEFQLIGLLIKDLSRLD